MEPRFEVNYHLLSIPLRQTVRLRIVLLRFCSHLYLIYGHVICPTIVPTNQLFH